MAERRSRAPPPASPHAGGERSCVPVSPVSPRCPRAPPRRWRRRRRRRRRRRKRKREGKEKGANGTRLLAPGGRRDRRPLRPGLRGLAVPPGAAARGLAALVLGAGGHFLRAPPSSCTAAARGRGETQKFPGREGRGEADFPPSQGNASAGMDAVLRRRKPRTSGTAHCPGTPAPKPRYRPRVPPRHDRRAVRRSAVPAPSRLGGGRAAFPHPPRAVPFAPPSRRPRLWVRGCVPNASCADWQRRHSAGRGGD